MAGMRHVGQHLASSPATPNWPSKTGMMLRLAFQLALRQTEGLMASIFSLLGVSLSTPDHSTLSRRARTMKSISKGCILPDGPIHLLIDSTGLKVFGAGEWLQEKHGAKARRTWRKLHLAVDADTGMIMASTLTGNDVGDLRKWHRCLTRLMQQSPVLQPTAHMMGCQPTMWWLAMAKISM